MNYSFDTKKARKITAMQYISLRKHSDMSELRSRYAKTSSEQADTFSFPLKKRKLSNIAVPHLPKKQLAFRDAL